jgi:hypothetical protein
MRNVSGKSYRKNNNLKKILIAITFFLPKIVPFMRQCGKNW